MKILIIHASAGAGHKKAAEAVHQGFKAQGLHESVCVDALDYTNLFFKYTYQGGYTLLVKDFSFIWGFVFFVTDFYWLKWPIRIARRIVNFINGQRLEQFLKKEQFDYIFSTHFLPNEVVSSLKRRRLIESKLVSVVTDFDVHRLWLGQGVDVYAVACEYTQRRLRAFGIPEEKIVVTGIPTDPKFSKTVNRDELKEKLGLKKEIFTVLIATGSFGMGPIEALARKLKGFQVLVVCGNNKNLLEKLTAEKEDHIKPFGFVNNMDELMAASDLMITKPGGLSIAEALVSRLPLLFFSAIPGQETNNAHILKSFYGIGITSNNIDEIVEEVKRLKGLPSHLELVKENIERLKKPAAVSDIIKLVQ